MSEADYMDDCEHADLYDWLHKKAPTHEVVDGRNRRTFAGSRAACWDYKRCNGGYVREFDEDTDQ